MNVSEGDKAKLTCSSKPTSAPDYYAKLVTLSYNWFVNNSKLDETRETMVLEVSRNYRFNQYSCVAKDTLESVQSDPIRINPLCKNNIIDYFCRLYKVFGLFVIKRPTPEYLFHCSGRMQNLSLCSAPMNFHTALNCSNNCKGFLWLYIKMIVLRTISYCVRNVNIH